MSDSSDLDTAIRAKLESLRTSYASCESCEGCEADCYCQVCPMAVAALLAVLDLHAAPERALPGELHCGEMIDWVQGGCLTVRTIAKALGIEAPGG